MTRHQEWTTKDVLQDFIQRRDSLIKSVEDFINSDPYTVSSNLIIPIGYDGIWVKYYDVHYNFTTGNFEKIYYLYYNENNTTDSFILEIPKEHQ